jgi:hypothetical protein
MRERVSFVTVPGLPPTQATVVVRAKDMELSADADVGQPAEDLDRQWELLSAKFFGLATPVIGNERASLLHAAIERMEGAPSMREVMALAGPEAH